MALMWADRFRWSGEIPADYPGLNPVALNRVEQGSGDGRYADYIDGSREWVHRPDGSATFWGLASGPYGNRMQMNGLNPETEKSSVQLDHFSGLWDGPRVLVGGWFWQRYIMGFNPLIDTRATDPFIYLSTSASGNPRHQIYSGSGELLLDQYEADLPWLGTTSAYFLGVLVDEDGTSQMFSATRDGRSWTGPVRTFSGSANFGATANVDVFSLRESGYWESGFFDEIVVAHPDSDFDLDRFADDLALGSWATGQSNDGDRDYYDGMTVTEDGIQYTGATSWTVDLGAERMSWEQPPEFDGFPTGSGTVHLSEDDGVTWSSPNDLPDSFDGLVRWTLGITSDSRFSGLTVDASETEVTPPEPEHDPENNTVTVTEADGVVWSHTGTVDVPEDGLTVTASPADGYTFPDGVTDEWTFELTLPPAPTLGSLDPIEIEQNQITGQDLEYSASTDPMWTVSAPEFVSASVVDDRLSVAAGYVTGSATVTVTLADKYGQKTEQVVEVTVASALFRGGPPPKYPHAPVVFWDGDGPAEVVIDALAAIVTKEINGAHDFNMTLPVDHEKAGVIKNERLLEVAGEQYRIRRLETSRDSGVPILSVYAEALFYDLATAGQIPAREWAQVTAGEVMEAALDGTGWSIGVANVSTLRTYDTDDSNPLELLRTVQENHGGDLLFDNHNKVVSLVVSSGRDDGVGFFYGAGLTQSRRVIDTTSLITRLVAQNADGVTIAEVNNGREYVEDFTYTDEVRTATYKFESGTSPYTMLSMANATLANRAKPDTSYEVTVEDLSALTENDLDRFDAGDYVTVVDPELDINGTQRVVKLEYDVVRPNESKVTLSARLRELGSDDSEEAGVLETGATVSTFDLVPFNLLLNGRFDNHLAHWAHSGAEVVDGDGTGDYAVRFEGSGERWIEQTVTPDNRAAYAFSFDLQTDGPPDWVPDVTAQATVTYEDGSTEVIDLELTS